MSTKHTNLSTIFLLILILVLTCFPCEVYAADNNGSIDSFPAVGTQGTDSLVNNNGSINTLYPNGSVTNNKGTITNCNGKVSVNESGAEINDLSGSTAYVGTNYGTIEKVENSATVNTNDSTGTITTLSSKLTNNYGKVVSNTGTIEHMYKGEVEINEPIGTISFAPDGNLAVGVVSIGTNNGTVNVAVSQTFTYSITITNNTQTLKITSGKVNLTNNTGTVTLSGSAELTCDTNNGTIILNSDDSKVTCTTNNNIIKANSPLATYTCTTNNGTILAGNYYKIIIRDTSNDNATIADANAIVDNDVCVTYENETYMVFRNSVQHTLHFTLPIGYHCDDTDASYDETCKQWSITCFQNAQDHFVASPDAGNPGTCYINCHECTNHSYGDYQNDNTHHWRVCSFCQYESKEAHVPVIDPRVEPTSTHTGLTEGSHCSICNKIIKAQNIIPVNDDPSGNNNKPDDNEPDDNNSGSASNRTNNSVANHSGANGAAASDNPNSKPTAQSTVRKANISTADIATSAVSSDTNTDNKNDEQNSENNENKDIADDDINADTPSANNDISDNNNIPTDNTQTSDSNGNNTIIQEKDNGNSGILSTILIVSGLALSAACVTGYVVKHKKTK